MLVSDVTERSRPLTQESFLKSIEHLNEEECEEKLRQLLDVNYGVPAIGPDGTVLGCEGGVDFQRETDEARQLAARVRKSNTSGYNGVCYLGKRNGWLAHWYEDGVQRKKFFAASKFGVEGAKNRACCYRVLQERRVRAAGRRFGNGGRKAITSVASGGEGKGARSAFGRSGGTDGERPFMRLVDSVGDRDLQGRTDSGRRHPLPFQNRGSEAAVSEADDDTPMEPLSTAARAIAEVWTWLRNSNNPPYYVQAKVVTSEQLHKIFDEGLEEARMSAEKAAPLPLPDATSDHEAHPPLMNHPLLQDLMSSLLFLLPLPVELLLRVLTDPALWAEAQAQLSDVLASTLKLIGGASGPPSPPMGPTDAWGREERSSIADPVREGLSLSAQNLIHVDAIICASRTQVLENLLVEAAEMLFQIVEEFSQREDLGPLVRGEGGEICPGVHWSAGQWVCLAPRPDDPGRSDSYFFPEEVHQSDALRLAIQKRVNEEIKKIVFELECILVRGTGAELSSVLAAPRFSVARRLLDLLEARRSPPFHQSPWLE